MELDEAQGLLGGWRRWQVLMYCMISTATMFIASWHMLAIVFVGYVPLHHCNVTDVSFIPPDTTKNEDGRLESCSMYVDLLSISNKTRTCDGWSYKEKKEGELRLFNGSTIVTQWDLVCQQSYKKDLTQTVLAFGVMIGAIVFSTLSDNYGRKPVFLFSQWAMIVVGTISAFITNYYVYIVLRFFIGALQQGIILTGFVLACELFPARYRTFAGIMIEDFWCAASCLMPLLAFLIVDWSYLQLFISLSGLLTIPLYWFVPESVSWLCANNRTQEAEDIIRKAAKTNRIEMPEYILTTSRDSNKSEPPDDEGGSCKKEGKAEGGCGLMSKMKQFGRKKEKASDTSAMYTLMDVFRNRRLRLYAIIMSILWMVNSMVYFGLSLSTATLAGDRFLNAFFSALVEGPAYTSSFFVLQRWGRRYPLIAYHCLAGVALIIANVLPDKTGSGASLLWLNITVQMIGKFGITGAFGIVFLYAPEIFPTTVRNQALGISSMLGRVGYVLTTYTPYVIAYVPWLPAPLFGSLSIVAGLLAIPLPETHNRPLPQTIEDIESWFKNTTDDSEVAVKKGEQELKPVEDHKQVEKF